MSLSFQPSLTSWTITLLGLALWFAPGQLSAHDLEPQRSIVAEVDDTLLSIMIVYEEIPGPRSDLLLARYDLNKDGQIDGQESVLAGREMLARMLAGLQFEVEFDTPKGHSPEIRFKTGPKGEVSAAAFISYDLASLASLPLPANRKVIIRLLPGQNNIPTEIRALARPGVHLLHVVQPPGSKADNGTTILSAGHQWTALFTTDHDAKSADPALPKKNAEPDATSN